MQAKPVIWSDETAAKLSTAIGEGKAFLEREIKAGVCQVWEMLEGKLLMITRSEGEELVIVAMQGQGMSQVAPDIIKRAKQCGFKSIRFHTKHLWLAEKLAKFGFNEQERIYSLGL